MPEFGSTARGQCGEAYVAAYLAGLGWKIRARNFHCRYGEIDLIAEKDEILAFVEVKARARDGNDPLYAVTRAKRRRIVLSAQQYLLQWPTNLQPRFDVAAVLLASGSVVRALEMSYYEDAFTLSDI